MAKLEELGLDKSTLVFYTTDNGAWQDVYPDAGYTPFRGTKGTVREGGNRVPAIAVWPGKIPAGVRNSDIVGGLDLWQDPQERYDVFMTNWTEHTWTLVTFNQAVADLMKTYKEYPPRKLQSEVYTGPVTLTKYQHFQWARDELEKEGVSLPMPTGN
jgi:hypothetical protein